VSYFFDSSALVKRYHPEPGSAWMWAVCRSPARIALYVSAVAEVEVVVALHRTARLEGKHPAWAAAQANSFLRHLAREYRSVAIDAHTVRLARTLATVHATSPTLRSMDAIQIAGALLAHLLDPDVVFVTADVRQATVAQREALLVVDPTYP